MCRSNKTEKENPEVLTTAQNEAATTEGTENETNEVNAANEATDPEVGAAIQELIDQLFAVSSFAPRKSTTVYVVAEVIDHGGVCGRVHAFIEADENGDIKEYDNIEETLAAVVALQKANPGKQYILSSKTVIG